MLHFEALSQKKKVIDSMDKQTEHSISKAFRGRTRAHIAEVGVSHNVSMGVVSQLEPASRLSASQAGGVRGRGSGEQDQ